MKKSGDMPDNVKLFIILSIILIIGIILRRNYIREQAGKSFGRFKKTADTAVIETIEHE